jgi:pimeloyl-ACP methyl ester carboxylesterase
VEGTRHSVRGADEASIGLLTAGTGPALLLVHGGMGRLEQWEPVCQRSSNPAVFLSAVQVIQHPDVQVIPHFRGRGSTTWAP